LVINLKNIMKKILLCRDFTEDNRTSMEVYADNLTHALQSANYPFEVKEYRPVIEKGLGYLPEKFNFRMRYARYISYPHQIKKQQADLYHITDHGYAHLLNVLEPTKTIVTVHDIIPLLWGRGLIKGIKPERRRWLNEWSFSFLKKASHVIADSSNTKKDLIEYCGCKEKKISVIYPGIDKRFKLLQDDKNQLRLELGLPNINLKLVLITGEIFYKNHKTSLKVIERLYNRDKQPVRLVRLGRYSSEWENVLQKSLIKEQVIHLNNLKPEQMPKLYNAVDCLLFPSWYEGFGWPPLEAMACGTPVVSSNAASLPEIVSDAGLIASPDDIEGLANAVYQLLENNELRDNKIKQGFENIKRFTWERNAKETAIIYNKVLGI
jgi:glycosyltransferase involved in cell wall biosynthesis